MSKSRRQEVIEANKIVHTQLSEVYNKNEPHFRQENVRAVRQKLQRLIGDKAGLRVLDMGCGTGFIVDILREQECLIHAIDVTPAMLGKVKKDGLAEVHVYEADSGTFDGEANFYDLITAYSFIHHLYEIESTLSNAYRMLKPGGHLYIDLEPNFYYWEALRNLPKSANYSDVILREIAQTVDKDSEIEKEYGIEKNIFNAAEFGKNIKGGLKADEVSNLLNSIGFQNVQVKYNWFLGHGKIINNEALDPNKDLRLRYGDICEESFRECLPLSRHLFKYLEFIASK